MMLVRMQADGRLPPHQRRNYRNVFHGEWGRGAGDERAELTETTGLYRVARDEGVAGWYRG